MHAFTQTASISTKGLWVGRVISGVQTVHALEIVKEEDDDEESL